MNRTKAEAKVQTAEETSPESSPEAIELLPLHEAVLDPEGVAQLFADIELAAETVEVRLKGGEALQSVGAATLAEAKRGIVTGSVNAAQISYVHRGQHWIDTLMRTPQGVRLVRAPMGPRR